MLACMYLNNGPNVFYNCYLFKVFPLLLMVEDEH